MRSVVILLSLMCCRGLYSYDITPVRLADGYSRYSGRLEVYYQGRWGTVCDDSFSVDDAKVICRMLGLDYDDRNITTHSSAFYGEGTGAIIIDELKCNGYEYDVSQCHSNPWLTNDCSHSEDVGISCLNYDVRLVDGPNKYAGRLEVLYKGHWGTVCDLRGYFDADYGAVVCRMLRNDTFNDTVPVHPYSYYGQGYGNVVTRDLQCNRTEDDISQCDSAPWRTDSGYCSHYYDVGVDCRTPIRLVGGQSPRDGHVEVFRNGVWTAICYHGFDRRDAEVICRSLGFSSRNTFYRSRYYNGYYNRHVNIDYLDCNGTEEDLSECESNDWGSYTGCNYYDAISIECRDTEVRLVDGPNKYAGRLEVLYNGQWSSVCDSNGYFDENDGDVVCRMLRNDTFNGNSTVHRNAYYGYRYDTSISGIHDLHCNGSEEDISLCRSSDWTVGSHYCNNNNVIGVDCNTPIRLVGGYSSHDGHVEVLHNGEWNAICRHGFDHRDAEVICRSLGYSYRNTFYTTGYYNGYNYRQVTIDYLNCDGTEEDLSECRSNDWGSYTGCSYHDSVSVDCRYTEVRLVGGPNKYAGSLEVLYNGQWSSVCDSNGYFDDNDGDVVCRMLRNGTFNGNSTVHRNAYYGHGYGSVSGIHDLHCNGSEEDISLCRSSDWTVGSHYCNHNNVIGVDCNTPIRLVGGYSSHDGHVEVLHNGQWTAICSHRFDHRDAEVICRSLGYSYRNTFYTTGYYNGYNYRQVTIDYLDCNGTEEDLSDCRSNNWGSYTGCSNQDSVSVDCRYTPVRLVDGPNEYAGRLEVYYNNQWGTVCDNNGYFDVESANVVCRMLHNGSLLSNATVYHNHHYGHGYGNVIMRDLQCNGNEADISNCNSSDWRTDSNYCSHYYDVGIDCNTKIRLVGGYSSHDGHVEVYHNDEWTSICRDSFDKRDAEVICRSLGLSTSDVSYTSGFYAGSYANHYGTIDYLGCGGNETDIAECGYGDRVRCSAYDTISVDCRETKIRLVNGSNTLEGRLEVYHDGSWKAVCEDYFYQADADVVCRMIHNISDSNVTALIHYNSYYGSRYGYYTIINLQCDGTEEDISLCSSTPILQTTSGCGYSREVGVDCRTRVRLVGGHNLYSGRVEVNPGNGWGTVCDDSFNKTDAIIICKMLGYYISDSYVESYQAAHYGQGNGSIIIDDLQCNGNEIDISMCKSTPWYHHNCGHGEDASIACRGNYYLTTKPYYRTTYPWTQHTTLVYRTTYPWWITTKGYSIERAISVRCNDYGWDITVDMYRLRQIYPGAIASDIYLGENSCTGNYNGYSVTFQQGLRECLTSERIRNDVLLYTNELVYAQHDPNHPFIIRHYNWTVGVECDVQRNETSSGHLHHDSNSNTGHYVTGTSHYTVNMTFFSDPNFLYPIQGNPLHVEVGTKVYVKVFTTASDWTIKMKVHTCYTKPTPNSPEHLNFNIIKDGCEVDSNTHIISQSSHETRFVFEDFEYTSNHEGIYVYCDATFCGSSDYSRNCLQTCNPVVKRRGVLPSGLANGTVTTTTETPVDELTTDAEAVTEEIQSQTTESVHNGSDQDKE